MQAIDVWHKFNIHRSKVVLLLLLFLGHVGIAQTAKNIHRPESDQKLLKYGFFLGFHQNSFNIRYSDVFDTDAYENVHSINSLKRPGFNLGFMVNFRLQDQFTLRVVPVKIGLYQYAVAYNYTDQPSETQLVESTRIEPGIFLKYRSIRRGNTRMYLVGGITGSLRSGKADEDPTAIRLNARKLDVKAEIGIGAEFYNKYFKFAPELRYSSGIINALNGDSNFYTDGLKRISTHVFTLYLHFSD